MSILNFCANSTSNPSPWRPRYWTSCSRTLPCSVTRYPFRTGLNHPNKILNILTTAMCTNCFRSTSKHPTATLYAALTRELIWSLSGHYQVFLHWSFFFSWWPINTAEKSSYCCIYAWDGVFWKKLTTQTYLKRYLLCTTLLSSISLDEYRPKQNGLAFTDILKWFCCIWPIWHVASTPCFGLGFGGDQNLTEVQNKQKWQQHKILFILLNHTCILMCCFLRQKEYDAFVSYGHGDSHWVLHELRPYLEDHEPHFRLCIHERDFLAGPTVVNNISAAINASRRTIVILSNSFLQSHWCRFEFKLAHSKVSYMRGYHLNATPILQRCHNMRDGISNHRSLDRLFNRLFRHGSKKTSKLRFIGLARGIHRWPVDSPHKGPETQKMFPFDDVIMIANYHTQIIWKCCYIFYTHFHIIHVQPDRCVRVCLRWAQRRSGNLVICTIVLFQVLKDRTNYLIMVLCKGVPETRMDEDMRLYLRTNTYLTKDDQWFKERLRRAMPCTPLATLQGEICCRRDTGGIPLGAEAQETNTGETSHQCSYRSPDDSSIHGCEPEILTCTQNPGPSFPSWNKNSWNMVTLTATYKLCSLYLQWKIRWFPGVW